MAAKLKARRRAGDPYLPAQVAALAMAGAIVWISLRPGVEFGAGPWGLVIAAAVLGLLPPVHRAIRWLHGVCARPSKTSRRWICVIITGVAIGFLAITAFDQHRDLFAKTPDECCYLIGMRMLARGRLWMPALPTPDFYDTFYMLVRPVYCPMYPPGAAMAYVPAIWLHLPTWVIPLLVAGAVVGAVYLLVAELVDGFFGLLAALYVLSLNWFRMYSVMLTSHLPMLLMGLLVLLAWQRWRDGTKLRWALAIGFFAGWGAITRPADALIFAVPVGIAMLWRQRPLGAPRVAGAIAAVVLGATPFLAIQGIVDYGVTGSIFHTPFNAYADRDAPNTSFGFHRDDPDAQPASPRLIKHEYYEEWARPRIEAHQPGTVVATWLMDCLPTAVHTLMPCRFLLLLLPVSLLGLRDPRVRVALATALVFVGVYFFYTFFLDQYALIAIPAAMVALMVGIQKMGQVWRPLASMFVLAMLAISFAGFWEINRLIVAPANAISDETVYSEMLRFVEKIPAMKEIHKPAVVLISYTSGADYLLDPVYNTTTAWPLDAAVIRVNDLGRRDIEIFRYFARYQPDRTFYAFSPRTGIIRPLGRADELAKIVK